MSETPKTLEVEKALTQLGLDIIEGADQEKAKAAWNEITKNRGDNDDPVIITGKKTAYVCDSDEVFGLTEPHFVIHMGEDSDEGNEAREVDPTDFDNQFIFIRTTDGVFIVAQGNIWRKEPELRIQGDIANVILDDIAGKDDGAVEDAVNETRDGTREKLNQ
jgi:hypothetical protein